MVICLKFHNISGHTALDLAISRMQYSSALILYQNGAKLRPFKEYQAIVRPVFNLPKFLECLIKKVIIEDFSIFYNDPSKNQLFSYKIEKPVDPTENWKQFMEKYSEKKDASNLQGNETTMTKLQAFPINNSSAVEPLLEKIIEKNQEKDSKKLAKVEEVDIQIQNKV